MKPVQQLNLNKHPVDVPNGSLLYAKNIRVSDDGKRLINEEGVSITNMNYSNQIVGVIPTYKDLIIFTSENEIFINDILVESDWTWEGGDVFGTWTQNVEGDYIVAISERDFYPDTKKVPLKIINISQNTKDGNQTKYTVSPNIPFYSLKFIEYVEGDYIPNGTYYFYIRYEISNNNYTKWFPCSAPIFAYNTDTKNILSYTSSSPMLKAEDGTLNQLLSSNIINTTGVINIGNEVNNNLNFRFNVEKFNNSDYANFQLGFIVNDGTDTKAYLWEKFDSSIGEIIFNGANASEITLEEIQENTFNLYNVKTMDNYNNRLYIANYEEDSTILDYDSSNIRLDVEIEELNVGIDAESNPDVSYQTLFKFIAYHGSIVLPPEFRSATVPVYKRTTNLGEKELVLFKEAWNGAIASGNLEGISLNDNSILHVYHSYTDIYVEAKNLYITTLGSYTGGSGEDFRAVLKEGNTYTVLEGTMQPYINVNGDDLKTGYSIRGYNMTPPQEVVNNNSNSNSYNFSKRLENSTLSPGEVYSFFIHFVKEDGSVSKGFRIKSETSNVVIPNIEIQATYQDGDKATLSFECVYDGSRTMADLKTTIDNILTSLIGHGVVPTNPITSTNWINYKWESYFDILNNYPYYKVYQVFGDLSNKDKNGEYTVTDLTAFQDDDYSYETLMKLIQFTKRGCSYYSNTNKDELFVIPYHSAYMNTVNKIYRYVPYFSNITIPDGYVGFFISTEKYEHRKSLTGIATLEDFSGQEIPDQSAFTKGLRVISNNLYSDSSSINGNILRIENKITYKTLVDYKTAVSYNRFVESIDSSTPAYRPYYNTFIIENKEVVDGDNSSDNNTGRERAIIVNKGIDLSDYPTIDANSFLTVSFISFNDNLYSAKFKSLYRIGNIKYRTEVTTYDYSISDGISLGNFLSLARAIVINQHGISIQTTRELIPSDGAYNYYYKWVKKSNVDSEYTSVPGSPYNIIEYFAYSDTLYELINIKNNVEETKIPFDIRQVISLTDVAGTSQVSVILPSPRDIQDLFESKSNYNIFNGNKAYDNFTGEEINIEVYDKFIRRSNVQQDESREIAWRRFQPDAYKQITENKGKITNIVGVGLYLLVHCEYSLYMFNRDTSLQTNNKDVQLFIPDAFDVEYQEVFTSAHGYGGLQDYTSWTLDDFGYIFYDATRYQIFRFDNKSLDILNTDIEEFIRKYKFTKCDFGNDFQRKRILLGLSASEDYAMLSYSLLTNTYISTHDYYYKRAYNTAKDIFLFTNNSFYSFTIDKGFIDIDIEKVGLNSIFPAEFDEYHGTFTSSINMIFNISSDIIKILAYIEYLFNRSYNRSYPTAPPNNVEAQFNRSYSGDYITINSEACTSGRLDISLLNRDLGVIANNQYMNYTKPRWNVGKWNFNYFRNTRPNANSYIYGKYFVLDFVFRNYNGENIEIEDISVNVKKYN